MLRLLRNRAKIESMGIEFARSHVLSRSAGHSAVKAAAYRSGEKLHDERTGRTADYSHRSSDVLSAQILLPEGADEKFLDRETLWSAVEDREDQHNRRASAQLAKDHIDRRLPNRLRYLNLSRKGWWSIWPFTLIRTVIPMHIC